MKARGGDLKYNWYAIKKNSAVAERVGYLEKGEIESEAQCTMEKLSYDFDSCRLWCMVENSCGYVLTDTVIVRVDREVDLRTNRTLAYICPMMWRRLWYPRLSRPVPAGIIMWPVKGRKRCCILLPVPIAIP
ncbi:hypothetical protein DXA95_03730 [Odoribacter sp. OF09-27XD]|nr:hypothetical protein DXA95_03730 [Odoribacter sp. OF09-27XD]